MLRRRRFNIYTCHKDKQILYDQAQRAVGLCMYFICLYTALTLYRCPTTWKATAPARGKDSVAKVSESVNLKSLRTVLTALNEHEKASKIEEEFGHAVLVEMRRSTNVLRADSGAQALAEPSATEAQASQAPETAAQAPKEAEKTAEAFAGKPPSKKRKVR